MTVPIDAQKVLDREFLPLRAKLLEIAAIFDRLERAEGTVADDPRCQKIRQALDILRSDSADQAEQIQLIISRLYDQQWRERMEVSSRE